VAGGSVPDSGFRDTSLPWRHTLPCPLSVTAPGTVTGSRRTL
jgi:hypothetical protein